MEQSIENKYKNAFYRDRPAHAQCDEFSIRHPKMALDKRAKLFSPFSALRGFDEAIDSKLERYVSRRELSEEDQEALNRALTELAARLREHRPVVVSVRYYVPCADENHEAYGKYGQYRTLTGTLKKLDPVLQKALRVEETVIELADLSEIRIETESGEED